MSYISFPGVSKGFCAFPVEFNDPPGILGAVPEVSVLKGFQEWVTWCFAGVSWAFHGVTKAFQEFFKDF